MKVLLIFTSEDMYSNKLNLTKSTKIPSDEWAELCMNQYQQVWDEKNIAALSMLVVEVSDDGKTTINKEEHKRHPLKEKILINKKPRTSSTKIIRDTAVVSAPTLTGWVNMTQPYGNLPTWVQDFDTDAPVPSQS